MNFICTHSNQTLSSTDFDAVAYAPRGSRLERDNGGYSDEEFGALAPHARLIHDISEYDDDTLWARLCGAAGQGWWPIEVTP